MSPLASRRRTTAWLLLCCGAISLGAQAQRPSEAPPSLTPERRAELEARLQDLTNELEAVKTALGPNRPADDSGRADEQPGAPHPPPELDLENAAEPSFFSERVAPILQRRCWSCHGPLRQRGGMRLDSRPAMLIGGSRGAAIVPGDAEASLLVRAIRREGELEMPPPRELDESEVRVLEAWVEAGATWPLAVASEAPAPVAAREVPSVTRDLDAGEPLSFHRDVLPILSNHCFQCHGPDERARQAGLRLDVETNARAELASGHRAVVGGELEASQLFQRIAAYDPADRMPPPHADKPLNDQQIEVLGRWILQGAEWRPHWAFVPPSRPEPPPVERDLWARNPVDRFVLARLEQESLDPAPEAARTTLIRRLSLDLTGIPPTPAEVDDFIADDSPDAYRRAVDRLLASPRYGEHLARWWLDAARYADTNGYHIDNERFMWRWRDWVIAAFNENRPFDELTVEQLAGDLLPQPTLEQRIATGFHRNHMINFEGGAIPEEYRTQYVFDRADTTATVWLGLTAGCAKCHDHKFDPLSQREYYQLAAFFNTVAEEGLDGQEGNADPLIPAPDSQQLERLADLSSQMAPYETILDGESSQLERGQAEWELGWQERLGRRWRRLELQSLISQGGAELTVLEDGSILASGPSPDSDVYEVTATLDAGTLGPGTLDPGTLDPGGLDRSAAEPLTDGVARLTALRLEALTDPSLPEGGFGRAPESGSFVLSEIELEISPLDSPFEVERVRFGHAYADHSHPFLPVRQAIDGDLSLGWSGDFSGREGQRTAVFVLEPPVDLPPAGALVRVHLRHESPYAGLTLGRFRLSVSGDESLALAESGSWHVAGPFAAEPAAWDRAFTPERGLRRGIDLGALYRDGRRRWVEVAVVEEEGESGSSPSLGPGVSYLFREIVAREARTQVMEIEAGGLAAWLNGERIAEEAPVQLAQADAEASPGNVEVKLLLRPGANQLLLKVWSEGGALVARRMDELPSEGDRELETVVGVQPDQRTEDQVDWLRRYFRRYQSDAWSEDDEARFSVLEEELDLLEAEIPTTMVMAEMEKPRPTFVLRRGQYDLHGERVEAATPSFLAPWDDSWPRDRLGLAWWLVDDRNSLTARVVVNRLWQRLFGVGLVKTSEDFGVQGELPSHPELLDWLAVELRESGWDLKALQRLLVSSATYRQSSRLSPELLEIDPENRLLARGPRHRLDGEVLRDQALAVSGLLVEKIGGPSVKPYQPAGLWEEIGYESRGRFSAGTFVQDTGEDVYRRSLYTFWKRTVPPPNMMVFDAPNRETCTVRRSRSNTPLQALTLMNDPQFVEAARRLAERLIAGASDPAGRVELGYRLTTARRPSPEESAVLLDLVDSQRDHYRSAREAAASLIALGDSMPSVGEGNPGPDTVELAAWTVAASVLLNLDETVTRQ